MCRAASLRQCTSSPSVTLCRTHALHTQTLANQLLLIGCLLLQAKVQL